MLVTVSIAGPDGVNAVLHLLDLNRLPTVACATIGRPRLWRAMRIASSGAKALHAAAREVFGAAGILQRCQWHKREDVLDYLPHRHRAMFRRKLQAALEPTYEKAKRALSKIRAELVLLNASAANSLDEGALKRR
jgi:hypothetical protein